MKPFFLVFARDEKHVDEKVGELKDLGLPNLIVCGKHLNYPNVTYRKPKGKYDAINFGTQFVPKHTDLVALNDVDTRINNLEAALRFFENQDVALVYARVSVKEGPQRVFYPILDFIRKRLPISASGELMLIRRNILTKILPIKPCKAEDSYILFKVLELKHRAVFCSECYVITERTKAADKEEIYKRKTVAGIYQALSDSKAPSLVRFFYFLLPFACPLLLVLGKKGYFWMKGILLGLIDYLRGDKTGSWKTTYME